MKLVEDMKNIDMSGITKAQAGRVKKKIAELKKNAKCDGDELMEYIGTKSGPCKGLWGWGNSTDLCYDIYKDVKPKQDLAAKMSSKKEKSERELAAI